MLPLHLKKNRLLLLKQRKPWGKSLKTNVSAVLKTKIILLTIVENRVKSNYTIDTLQNSICLVEIVIISYYSIPEITQGCNFQQ